MEKTTDTKIRTKIKALINKGANRLDSIKKLEREYKIPLDQLNKLWLQVKSNMKYVPLTVESTKEERKELLKDLEKTPAIKRTPTKHIDKKVIEEIKAERELKNNDLDARIRENVIPYVVTEKEIEENQNKGENKMNDTLGGLNTHLFAELQRLSVEELKGEALQEEILRAKAVGDIATRIIANASVVLQSKRVQAEIMGRTVTEIPKMLEG